jgi:hypothetical protein
MIRADTKHKFKMGQGNILHMPKKNQETGPVDQQEFD